MDEALTLNIMRKNLNYESRFFKVGLKFSFLFWFRLPFSGESVSLLQQPTPCLTYRSPAFASAKLSLRNTA
jgi:hypothetical protein